MDGCVFGWGPSKVIAMATRARGPSAVLSGSTGHRGSQEDGGETMAGGEGQEGERGGSLRTLQLVCCRHTEVGFMAFYSAVHSDRTRIITERYKYGSKGVTEFNAGLGKCTQTQDNCHR